MISVIISTCNEEASIRRTIAYVFSQAPFSRLLKEVIVVDGGSTDRTINEVRKTDAKLIIVPGKGSSIQFNEAASQATGDILYFLNARSLPPKNFINSIAKAVSKGYSSGTFTLAFDYKHWLLDALSWCTRRKSSILHLSDQSLFMSRELFDKSGGFREDHIVMSTQEMVRRLRRYSNFIVLKDNIIASAARYLKVGVFKTQIVQGTVYILHKKPKLFRGPFTFCTSSATIPCFYRGSTEGFFAGTSVQNLCVSGELLKL
jgi:glycosyltransferase involved in cell wall biosynthesis